MSWRKRSFISGFTFVELMVVSAIVALLIVILLPSLRAVRAIARLAVCTSTIQNLVSANNLYSADWYGFSVHGEELVSWAKGPSNYYTGYGFGLFPTAAFDDDFANSQKGEVPPTLYRNEINDGAQNICGAGQLMWDDYIAEASESIGCPQADFDEITKFSDHTGNAWWDPADYKYVQKLMEIPRISDDYWRNDYFEFRSPAHRQYRTNYMVRGPMFRVGDITNHDIIATRQDRLAYLRGSPKAESQVAIFVDHEAASQQLTDGVNNGLIELDPSGTPVPHWPRRHITGLNVAYADGHVALFHDENRQKTWSQQGRFKDNFTRDYHNGWALFTHVYDLEK